MGTRQMATQNKLKYIEEAFEMLGFNEATAEEIIRIHPILNRRESTFSMSTFMSRNGFESSKLRRFYGPGSRRLKVFKRKLKESE